MRKLPFLRSRVLQHNHLVEDMEAVNVLIKSFTRYGSIGTCETVKLVSCILY